VYTCVCFCNCSTVYCGRYMKLCRQYCVTLLGRSLNTCHCHLFYLSYYIICVTFICVLAKGRVLYIRHQNCMLTGPVVLHTGNFVGYCQGCGVLTVLYYKMVLKYTAHKLVNSSIYDGTLKDYTQQFLEHPNCKYCKAVGNASIQGEA